MRENKQQNRDIAPEYGRPILRGQQQQIQKSNNDELFPEQLQKKKMTTETTTN